MAVMSFMLGDPLERRVDLLLWSKVGGVLGAIVSINGHASVEWLARLGY